MLPGYGAGDASTVILQSYLRSLGYRADGWRLGRNTGNVPAQLPRAAERVAKAARRAGGPVPLIGWSLGGYLAREVARDRPEHVEQVITLGTPVVGGPKYTAVARSYRDRGVPLDAIEAAIEARNRRPIERPVTAIFPRNDRVVAWQACIDHRSPDVEHVEVTTTHVGMGSPRRRTASWPTVSPRGAEERDASNLPDAHSLCASASSHVDRAAMSFL